ncbi:hypothetical protein AB1J28_18830 [Lysinibacillus irui]|uniref:hypothetical protein n=1 Tax=Lysinibacillus irui TaxID=2998077 RepID=UPI003D2C6D5A
MDDLILETIESYNNYLQVVPNGCLKIAERLREDQIAVALNDIKDFSEGVIWLIDAGILLSKNNVDVSLDINQIQDFLNEINTGLQIKDYNLVGDLFEYEIAEFFKAIALIKNHIEQ